MGADYDDQIKVPPGFSGDSGTPFIRKSVIVYSAGPDGKFETIEDNVTTWTELKPRRGIRWAESFLIKVTLSKRKILMA